MKANYSINEIVKAGLNDTIGTIIDREDHPVSGWSYQVKFLDGTQHWFASTDLRKVFV